MGSQEEIVRDIVVSWLEGRPKLSSGTKGLFAKGMLSCQDYYAISDGDVDNLVEEIIIELENGEQTIVGE